MKKILLVFVIMAALWGGTGHLAAKAKRQANCVGQYASSNAGRGFGPFVSSIAREAGGLGQFVGPAASSNVCNFPSPYPGPDPGPYPGPYPGPDPSPYPGPYPGPDPSPYPSP